MAKSKTLFFVIRQAININIIWEPILAGFEKKIGTYVTIRITHIQNIARLKRFKSTAI